MRENGYLRLVIAMIAQAIEDVRHPQVWDYWQQERAKRRALLQAEARAWLLDSDIIELAAHAWNLSREELIRRVAEYPKVKKEKE
mgnify:CR=1 FL=1